MTDTHAPRGTDVCIDCGTHIDAAVHHTPERLAAGHVGQRMAQDPLDEGATLLASALCPPHHGWGPLAEPCRAALLDLIAAGWTPPSGTTGDDEVARLRAQVARMERQSVDDHKHLHRLGVEDGAFGEFRATLIGAAYARSRNEMQLADLQADTKPRYSAAQFYQSLKKILDGCDKAADSYRKHRAEQRADWTAQRERTQAALFDLIDETGSTS